VAVPAGLPLELAVAVAHSKWAVLVAEHIAGMAHRQVAAAVAGNSQRVAVHQQWADIALAGVDIDLDIDLDTDLDTDWDIGLDIVVHTTVEARNLEARTWHNWIEKRSWRDRIDGTHLNTGADQFTK